jgi:hypothetical protein
MLAAAADAMAVPRAALAVSKRLATRPVRPLPPMPPTPKQTHANCTQHTTSSRRGLSSRRGKTVHRAPAGHGQRLEDAPPGSAPAAAPLGIDEGQARRARLQLELQQLRA